MLIEINTNLSSMQLRKHRTLFIFRRDLRIEDNLALLQAAKVSKTIYPIFIFNPEQVETTKNSYYSPNSFRFMLESLAELKTKIPLQFYHGDEQSVIKALLATDTITAIVFNRDYTPFARQRDKAVLDLAEKYSLDVTAPWGDYSLVDIPNMQKPYKVYGAFLKTYFSVYPSKPSLVPPQTVFQSAPHTKYSINNPNTLLLHKHLLSPRPIFKGGRHEAMKRLSVITLNGKLKNYSVDRDIPSKDGTSLMSGWLKYGCISVRELYWAVRKTYGKKHGILRELYWRAFYEQMVYWWPETLRGQITQPPLPNKPWSKTIHKWNNNHFQRITTGTTSIPIIDASIRALNTTGYLHNRLRMILCMYAVRHKKVDWRLMERWFATKLIDYYPPSNRGGWEWAVIYRFKLSPERQTKRFDPDHTFIKSWLPKK
jgi:deoxyribodipyrimidine photo-lyase